MTTRALITGINGFSGRHLAARLSGCAEFELCGFGTAAASDVAEAHYIPCDLTDAYAVSRAVDAARPQIVFHLAARIAGSAELLHDANVHGFVNLCHGLRRFAERSGTPVRLLVVGSAAELGAEGMARLPVREDAVCRPESSYGRTKLEATERALSEPLGGLIEIVVARAFNLVGPGIGSQLALGRFARQLAAYERGDIDRVRCGNTSSRRDFVDVREAAEAYLAIARHGRPGQLYNVCSGRSHGIGDLFERMIEIAGFEALIEQEALPGRVEDPVDVYGDPTKTTTEIGWTARMPIERSLEDLLAEALKPANHARPAA